MRLTRLKLLKVLLAKEAEVSAGLQAELGDDGRHAIEMAPPEGAAQAVADTGHRNVAKASGYVAPASGT